MSRGFTVVNTYIIGENIMVICIMIISFLRTFDDTGIVLSKYHSFTI